MTTSWSELSPKQPLAPLVPCALLVYTDDESRIVALSRVGRKSQLRVTAVGTDRVLVSLPPQATTRALARWVLEEAARVMLLPPLVRAPAKRGWFRRRNKKLTLLGQEEFGVDLDSVHEFALAIEKGTWWHGKLPAAASGNPGLRVERIRDQYATLKLDLVYRIENPALFDPAVPTTSEFEAALAGFDPTGNLKQRAEQAHRIELAFALAREHAERAGMRHVAQQHRSDLRRAAKAARLAVGSSTPGERAAALAQVQRILDSLALYYLPRQAELKALPSGDPHE